MCYIYVNVKRELSIETVDESTVKCFYYMHMGQVKGQITTYSFITRNLPKMHLHNQHTTLNVFTAYS